MVTTKIWSQHLIVRGNETARQTLRMSPAKRKRSPFGDGGYILLIIPAAAFCLGTWQVRRREWKLSLIESLEEKTHAPPIPLPLDLDELRDLEYRRIYVRGTFDHSKEMLIGLRSNINQEPAAQNMITHGSTGSGYHVVTPFMLTDRNMTILVNRGFVPRSKMNPAARQEGQVKGEVELVGVVRHSEKRRPFITGERPQGSSFWMLRNVEKMAEEVEAMPVFIDADHNSTVPGGPLGGQTNVSLRNEHLSYIITWYSLCAITLFMWYKRYRRPVMPDGAYDYLKKSR